MGRRASGGAVEADAEPGPEAVGQGEVTMAAKRTELVWSYEPVDLFEAE